MNYRNENSDHIDDSVTKNVMDYYKKYSQNPDLPKYFSGSSLSYLPEFKENVDENIPEIIIQTDLDIIITTEGKNDLDNTSRASSPMSNKKLEWDNGADIGYDNCQNSKTLKKSCSLPIISGSNKKQQISPGGLDSSSKGVSSSNICKQDEKVPLFVSTHSESESSSPVALVPISSKSSTSMEEHKSIYSSSRNYAGNKLTSSSDSSSQKNISDFKNTLSYLKKKIGLPEAQSTPQSSDIKKDTASLMTETPMLSDFEKRVRIAKNVLNEHTKSCETILDSKSLPNCGEVRQKKKEKSVKLCLTKPIFVECFSSSQKSTSKKNSKEVKYATVAIQTDQFLGKELVQIIERHSIMENQGLEFCEHSDSDPNTISTQTGSDLLVSNCNSFRYLRNCEGQNILNSFENNAMQKHGKNDLPILSIKEQLDSSEDFSISSNILGDDIEKNTQILQKLLKSKKYDNATKRRYIKKILQKMVDSKCLEESSNSSELFLPKRAKTGVQNLAIPPSTDSSSKSAPGQSILQISGSCSQSCKLSPRKRKQASRILATEIKSSVYGEAAIGSHVLPINTKEIGIVNNSEDYVNPILKNKISSSEPSKVSNSTLENHYDSINSSKSKCVNYQNWKEDKTYSEKLFEANPPLNGDGDYLNQVANNERQYQISWINNEINHLGKLKILLQKHELNNKLSRNKPKKVTSVYVVSDENASSKDPKSDRSQKKYVIETNLGPISSNNRKFKIGDRNYNVKDLSSPTSFQDGNSNSPPILGNIEVVSSEETVNIKVTTFCEGCKTAPCICSMYNLSNVKLKQPTMAKVDDKEPTLIERTMTDRNLCCHRKTYTKESPSILDRHCPLCDLYKCNCTEKMSLKHSYDGQFIPCLPEKQINILSSRSKASFNVEPPHPCLVCLKIPCQCLNIHHSGSLKKVFENCMCRGRSTCNCNFVNKIYQHFKTSNQAEIKMQDKKENIAIQTELDVVNTETQTTLKRKNEVSQQNGNRKELFETIGVQCNVDMQHASSQISRELKSLASQTLSKEDINLDIVDNIEYEVTRKNQSGEVSISHQRQKTSKADSANSHSRYQQINDEDIQNVQKTNDRTCNDGNIQDANFKNVENIEVEELFHKKYSDKSIFQKNGNDTSENVGKLSSELSCATSSKSSREKKDRKVSSGHRQAQSIPSVANTITSSTAISPYGKTTSTTSSSSSVTCICCKKLTNRKDISIFHYDNENYLFCSKCIKKKPILTSICYTGAEYVCSCSQSEPIESLKEQKQEYCTCINPLQYRNTRYCGYCQFKLRKTLKSKNGIAYTLTLESDSPRKHKIKRRRKKELEEIKIKIPCPYRRKKRKDKENFYRKDPMKPGTTTGTNDVDDTHDSTIRDNITINSTNDETKQTETIRNNEAQSLTAKRNFTLQEHLMKNRPDFIDSAEYRRHALLTSKEDREIRKDEVKIRFLEENSRVLKTDRPKLFTEREMREITKKNYKKLPEVQQKLKDSRNQALRCADKCIFNTFTKRIQKSILKGKSTFPIDTNIVDVYK